MHKTGEMQASILMLVAVEANAKEAYNYYCEAKKKSSNWHNKLLDLLFEAWVQENTMTRSKRKIAEAY
jgi:hypothetical protein